ncbi:hypothetical protein [Candidatus Formimonas warabiya]|uniref:Uroporphyrinogen decarboxylase (URO-D) domain-containing protein n=1 Tax=Formimonas warabiya TaxID=1761012 RepID=A0A3G1L026_FORW1|nr:hypothetical protein [Candidatus Formimonas warabiya]ATW28020.1 hypothetical protein DCMF_27620 [Candidatus Formimonas warabiya]
MLHPEEMNKRLNRHLTFWGEGFKGEGAYIAVQAPDETVSDQYPEIEAPLSLEERWFNIDYRLEKFQHRLQATYFAGDAVPSVFVDFGSGNLAAMLGAAYKLAEDTIWFDVDPPIKDWNQLPAFRLHRDEKIYQAVMETTHRLCAESKGRYLVGVTDIGANIDILAALRNRQNLLMDFIEETDAVKEMVGKINGFWREVFLASCHIINRYLPGITSFTPIFNPRKWYKLMSEVSVMISPAMFEEIVCPALQEQIDFLNGQALFNLDGQDQIRHLPFVLRLKGLHAIEWNPVPKYQAGHKCAFKDFTDPGSLKVCREIQAAGKKLVLCGIRPEQVETVFRYIAPDGVFLFVHGTNRKDADEFLLYAQKWRKCNE